MPNRFGRRHSPCRCRWVQVVQVKVVQVVQVQVVWVQMVQVQVPP